MIFDADPWDYLAADEAVDLEHPLVQATASTLRVGDDLAYAQAAFEYVRDEIEHSMDVQDPRVTWRASDVLDQGVGLCFAQAHALVALLRAGGIQAGFCYQPFDVLHGLVATLIDDRWVRLDPRGKDVEFSAAEDRLAFPGTPVHPTVYAAPHPAVLTALKSHTNALALCEEGLPTPNAL
ncbi:transglutaminase-like domain-containing protein [Actinomadura rudentiformis]|uniref:Transglutaminase family protein n=1 Tax=Actinomadura rudentiformis TaxID=359158 RepID=A0A6H9YHC4_9ACTN|nr:transglutaminase family protein [Actinomadura rudentiformis]KAB2345695.1 transglutaminase family protein [Actinomadura rudentiformis]